MNLLFVCTGNTCRSPIAEVLFRDMLKKTNRQDVECQSAGIAALEGMPASCFAIETVQELGLDLSAHAAKRIDTETIKNTDLFVTMTDAHKQTLMRFGIGEDKIFVLGHGISDPFGGTADDYRRCRDEIAKELDNLIGKII